MEMGKKKIVVGSTCQWEAKEDKDWRHCLSPVGLSTPSGFGFSFLSCVRDLVVGGGEGAVLEERVARASRARPFVTTASLVASSSSSKPDFCSFLGPEKFQ